MIKETNRPLFKPSELALAGDERRWTLALSGFCQLLSKLVDTSGEVNVVVTASYGSDRRLLLDITVDTTLHLQCQRCLEPGDFALHSHSSLLVVGNDEQAAQCIDDDDPIVTDEDGMLSVTDLVSDEILLALPLFYMHEGDDCPFDLIATHADNTIIDERPKPFSALKAVLASE